MNRMQNQNQVLEQLRSVFRSGITIPAQFRLSQLNQLMSMIQENEEVILKALHQDLAKVRDGTHTHTCLL